MAFSKAPLFPKLQFQQSSWSKALAHPARIIILNHLLEHGTTAFRDLCKLVPLAPTTTSQHLRHLRKGHFIRAEERFPYTYYSLDRKVCSMLAILLTELQENFIRE